MKKRNFPVTQHTITRWWTFFDIPVVIVMHYYRCRFNREDSASAILAIIVFTRLLMDSGYDAFEMGYVCNAILHAMRLV